MEWLLLVGFVISVIIAYKVGKWENGVIAKDLDYANIRLVGELYKLKREVERIKDRETERTLSELFVNSIKKHRRI